MGYSKHRGPEVGTDSSVGGRWGRAVSWSQVNEVASRRLNYAG